MFAQCSNCHRKRRPTAAFIPSHMLIGLPQIGTLRQSLGLPRPRGVHTSLVMGQELKSSSRAEALAVARATMMCALQQLDVLKLSLVASQLSLAIDTLDKIEPTDAKSDGTTGKAL